MSRRSCRGVTSPVKNDLISTTALAAIGRAAGFFVPLVIAAGFGSSAETDVFFLVYGLMLCLMIIIGHACESVVVPHITDERAAGCDSGQLVGMILARSTLLLVSLLLAAALIVKPTLELLTRLSPQALDLAVAMFALMAPTVILMAWTATLNGALNASKNFQIGALSPMFRSLVVIAFAVLLGERWGVRAVAVGFVAGETVRFFASLQCFQRRFGMPQLCWRAGPAGSRFFRSAGYQVAGFGCISFIPVVNHLTASWLAPGDLSLNAYAAQLRNVPSLLFTAGAGTVVLAHWATRYSSSTEEFTWQQVRRVVGKLSLLAAAAASGLIVFSDPLVWLAFGRGAFPADQMPLVARLFAILVASLPFDVAALLATRIVIIVGRDRAYLLLAGLKLVALVLLNSVFVPRYGLLGVALATTSANILYATALLICVSKFVPGGSRSPSHLAQEVPPTSAPRIRQA